MYSTTISLALLALAPVSQAAFAHSPHPEGMVARRSLNTDKHRRFRRKGDRSPTNLAPGSLSASEGCTRWVRPVSGDSCYSVIADVGISLDTFYKLNEQLDDKCFNLLAGYDYCTHTGKSGASKSAKVAKTKEVKVATPTAAATATATASASAADDEDGDCEAITTTTTKAKKTKPTKNAKVAAATTTSAAPAPASTTPAAAPAAASPASSSSSSPAAAKAASTQKTGTVLAAAGVSSFLGTNSGIGSWFHTDLSSDSTNGHSWCGFPYNDDVPGFAPSVGTMLKNFGGDYNKAATAYCGLEALVCNGDNCQTLVIADGFDDAWVLSPGSIDIVYNAFSKLFGKVTTNKDDVIKGVTWTLTGGRNEQYKFKGQGSG